MKTQMVMVSPSGPAPALPAWAERLGQARTLVEVSRRFFELTDPQGLALELFDSAGQPVAVIANSEADHAGWARAYLDGGWLEDPGLATMRAWHTVVALADLGPDEDSCGMLVGPLIRNGRLIGTLRFVSAWPLLPRNREKAQAVSAHVSVRLAELGFGASESSSAMARLTERQREVAGHVAAGYSTSEIAAVLGVSPNTVKKHLKQIFETLELDSRTELAVIASRCGPSLDELVADHGGLHVEWAPRKVA